METSPTFADQMIQVVESILSGLDPSLFQNIIIGILAILIPFAIVFFTDILSNRNKRTTFEKMVLSEEVLGADKIFWVAVWSLLFLSFFSGNDISPLKKLIAIFFTLWAVYVIAKHFMKTLRFSEGNESEYEASFLKKLGFSNFFIFTSNRIKAKRLSKVWDSFWEEATKYDEKGFTDIFVSHVDDAIITQRYNLSANLGRTYEKNLEKRNIYNSVFVVYPKLFDWIDELWVAEQKWYRRIIVEEKLGKFLAKLPFPLLKTSILNFYKKMSVKDEAYMGWRYFRSEFFNTLVKKLIENDGTHYSLFDQLKKYIDKSESKLAILDDKYQTIWENHIKSMMSSFFSIFFKYIVQKDVPFDTWEHYFPAEWKITSQNPKRFQSGMVLYEFLIWVQPNILKEWDVKLSDNIGDVIKNLLPNADPRLFFLFLLLRFSPNVKYAIQRDVVVPGSSRIYMMDGPSTEEERSQMIAQNRISEQEDVVDIVLKYFGSDWEVLKITTSDVSAEENVNWLKYPEVERYEIIKRVRKKKLEKLLEELNSKEVLDVTMASVDKEFKRMEFIELTTLLLEKIS